MPLPLEFVESFDYRDENVSFFVFKRIVEKIENLPKNGKIIENNKFRRKMC